MLGPRKGVQEGDCLACSTGCCDQDVQTQRGTMHAGFVFFFFCIFCIVVFVCQARVGKHPSTAALNPHTLQIFVGISELHGAVLMTRQVAGRLPLTLCVLRQNCGGSRQFRQPQSCQQACIARRPGHLEHSAAAVISVTLHNDPQHPMSPASAFVPSPNSTFSCGSTATIASAHKVNLCDTMFELPEG